jgi:metal-responsive CopG/Arc/MetJ family transcriptional regulator
MESITIKVEERLAKEISKAMSPDYATKTEFIREAIREKIKKIRQERTIREIVKNFGKSEVKTSLEEDRAIREKVGREIAAEFGIKLNPLA